MTFSLVLQEYDDKNTIHKISAKWLTKRLDCTLEGITRGGGCGGGCCKTRGYWPGKTGADGVCPRLGATGCTMPLHERPVTCLLYPLRFNKSGTLVAHDKAFLKNGVCAPCYNKGPLMFDALQEHLSVLFGAEQINAARDKIISGRDAIIFAPPWVMTSLENEHKLEEKGLPPQPRRNPL